ncbi:ceramide glucosyltransferase [Roseiarcus fermentans]|uniref:Ceramide glucosyltransferase n=1 Tax=Roseiarcus fermentans TaxID=1473586 RepID=A0A366FBZ4_9HYPH|nr:bacteriohopanetetrol glucosamine biosynthesis glycosyltransferase HpnI [Roseiarcus fermentans]RBP12204.1 ceramide glucosyltransferase [Roseiarcus fermentans]
MTAIAVVCLVVAAAGCLYLLAAIVAASPPVGEAAPAPAAWPSATILKPLRGDEPALSKNLASFCDQDYPAPVQIVFGVQAADDPAIAVVTRLAAQFPGRDLRLVVDAATHGANRKISNLVNMAPAIAHEVVVLADSDIAAPKDYLRRVAAALLRPGVGGVTLAYHGVPVAGFWSQLSALAIDAHFLPNVLLGLRLGLAAPCFGSTIALRRHDLDAIGGFAAFADVLADDYAIGAALRARGLGVAAPRLLVGHACAERSLAELWRHEMRWARTIQTVDFWGYLGSAVTHPLPFALLAAAAGAPVPGLALAGLAIAGRVGLLRAIMRSYSLPTPAYWLLPLRDLLSFATFAWSFCGREVIWRGERRRVLRNGVLTAD